jgi:hypothetical protein
MTTHEEIPIASTVNQDKNQGVITLAVAKYYSSDQDPSVQAMRKSQGSANGVGVCCVRAGELALDGAFVVPKSIRFLVICNGAKVDMSRAMFVHPKTTITVVAVCGGAEIVVPPGVRTEVSGLAIFGGFERDHAIDAIENLSLNAPVIRIRGVAVFGGVSEKVNVSVPRLRML